MKVSFLAKPLCLLFLSSLPFSAFSYVQVKDLGHKIVYDFAVDSVKLENKNFDGHQFAVATLEGVDGYTGINYEVGSPEIPVIRFNVQAKDSDSINVLTRNYFSTQNFPLTGAYKPVLAPLEKIAGSRYQIAQNENFKSLGAFPEGDFEVKEVGQVRGEKLFQVTLFPVQFVGVDQEIQVTRAFHVEVTKAGEGKVSETAQEAMIFVVGSKFKNSTGLKNYMDLKASLGMVVSQIDASGLNPDQIRKKIKTQYAANKNLKYVVIIGDAADVPGMDSTTIYGVTDHYYAAIDTENYSTDIRTPDLFVGRISAATVPQLETILLKYTRYIKGDFTSRAWMDHASFLATDDRWELAEGTHNYAIDTYTKERGYTGAFPSATQAGGDKLYAVTHNADNTDVMKAFVQGRSIIDYSGHGATTYWDAPRMTQADVTSLTYSSLPFVISNACITGDFRIAESFAETWQRHEWGAVMFWGSMDSTYWDEDDILEKRMFDGIFKEGKASFGAITQFALIEMAKFYGGNGRSNYYFETYHMFGDPSIALRLK